jgi:hypothetical protein
MTGDTVLAHKGLHRGVQTVLQLVLTRGKSRGDDRQKQTQNQQSHERLLFLFERGKPASRAFPPAAPTPAHWVANNQNSGVL